MAASKVESWKKTAAYAVDGLTKQLETVAKELADLDKKRKAVKDALEKFAENVSKKIKLDDFPETDQDEVEKFRKAVFETVKRKSNALKGYGEVDPSSAGTKTSLAINFSIRWSDK
jgi:hypothetical protein